MKKVVAVVLNWNRPDDTIACVESLRAGGYAALEIVVVDNASGDDSVARFRKELGDVTLLLSKVNGGYAAGNNIGIREALARQADHVLVLNNDVVVTPGFLDPMVAELEADPGVGVVTCDARFQSDTERSYPTGGSMSRLRGAGVRLPRRRRDQRVEVDFVSGCILLVRREVFERLGLFDESFFMYFEDVEFSRRVGSAFRIVYTPRAVVYHRSGGGGAWATQTPTYLYYMARNRFMAFRRDPLPYRTYLVLVGAAAAVAKTAAIGLRAAGGGSRSQAGAQLRALWSGFASGAMLRSGPPAGPRGTTQGVSPR